MKEYHQPQNFDKDEAVIFLESCDAQKVCNALVGIAYNCQDWEWVERQCLEYTKHPNNDVRALAVTCLGHVVRIHRKLNLDRVLPRLKELESDDLISGRVEDVYDDIETYIGKED